MTNSSFRFAGLIFAGALAVVSSASAWSPQPGIYWNSTESGTGYTVDVQDNTLILTIYSYEPGGAPTFYLASGALAASGTSFSATMYRYVGGQCLGCTFSGPPAGTAVGTVSMSFASPTKGSITLPNGRTLAVERFNAIGEPPSALLGEWVFVYDIGSTTWAERFNFTEIAPGTSNGNGIVLDRGRIAACEYQVSGGAAGYVICADSTASGTVENGYAFKLAFDEGFEGTWISPVTGSTYAMNAFRTRTRSGLTHGRSYEGAVAIEPSSKAKLEMPGARPLVLEEATSIMNAVSEIAAVLRESAVRRDQ